ncbi:caspase family protein [uncultured Fibrobacter sp.]|uniref:caspase family protein n=1 Tax=uncultured Fibrobacter sp. TaxID=261512 RepID=UPI00260211B8|nr:caspase family protein [uncultured Fibrobacter sp.]
MKKILGKILSCDFGMSSIALCTACLVAILAVAGSAHAAGESIAIERYVFAVSANNGGKERPRLRYAESDARAFANVLSQMGGVPKANVHMVTEPSVASLQKQLDALDKKLVATKTAHSGKGANATNGAENFREEVLVYYSGHADEKGLRLGEEVYSWKEFRKRIDALNADVKIAVIDACGSGAITRVKGGVAVPAFMVDKSSDMKGYAFITSSTQDESSQESDKLKGSFFTHSLVSGLRGAGDVSGDGKVTLSEAYQFAFNETLQKTEATMGGAQHPSRDMNLAGTGDVVMTDLRSTSAGLELDEDIDGHLFIRDEKGELVAELYKKPGRAMSLGFPAGKYSVRLERPAEYKEATVSLQDNYRARLSQKQFNAIAAEKTMLRGEIRSEGRSDSVEYSLDSLDHNGKYRVTFNLVDKDREPRKGLQMGLFVTRTDNYMLGSQISLFANIARKEMHGLQLTATFNGAKEHFEGAQVSSVVNYAGSFDGLQISPVANIAKSKSSGAQVSAALNYVGDTLSGMQIAPAANCARVAKAQVSAAINVASESDVQATAAINIASKSNVQASAAMNIAGTSDVQATAAMNIAGESNVQASVLNIAGRIDDVQAGVVNISGKANGRQVGLVNICGSCEKTPVGLINIVGNGVWSVTASMNEMGALGLSFHMGTAYLFTALEGARLIEKGTQFKEFSDVNETGIGLGTQFGKYGSHFEMEYMFLTAQNKHGLYSDFSGFEYNDGDDVNFHHRLRLGYTTQVFPFFGLSVGGSLNFAHEITGDKLWLKPLAEYHDDFGSKDHKARWWPGFYAAVTVGKF